MPVTLAVICDMDGVLLDTEKIALRAWTTAAASNQLEFSDGIFRGMIGLSHRGTKIYLRDLGWPDASIERVFTDSWKLYIEYLQADGTPQKAGIVELLDFLDAHAIPRAVATSTDTALAVQQLDRARLSDRFNTIVGGDQVTNGKPAPDIFLLAAAKLRHKPRDCVVLEDSQPGIHAAIAAGMQVMWVPDLCDVDQPTQQLTCGIARSLTDAAAIIEQLLTDAAP